MDFEDIMGDTPGQDADFGASGAASPDVGYADAEGVGAGGTGEQAEDAGTQAGCDDAFDKIDRFGEEAAALFQANDELELARRGIVDLLAEIEDILLRQNPRIEAEWQVVIGAWENRLLEAQIAMRRARRKCSLLQTCVNRNDAIDLQAVESQLDQEFETWQLQLDESVERYQTALASQLDPVYVSAAEANRQKKLVRTLAKRLHPDVHPEHDEATHRMFSLAEMAYRRGDTKILESLEVSTRNLEPEASFPATMVEAQAELALLEAQRAMIAQRLKDLKAEEPYCLRMVLNDPERVQQRIDQMKDDIAACNRAEREYLSRCDQMVGLDE